jgi:hypothetical protein
MSCADIDDILNDFDYTKKEIVRTAQETNDFFSLTRQLFYRIHVCFVIALDQDERDSIEHHMNRVKKTITDVKSDQGKISLALQELKDIEKMYQKDYIELIKNPLDLRDLVDFLVTNYNLLPSEIVYTARYTHEQRDFQIFEGLQHIRWKYLGDGRYNLSKRIGPSLVNGVYKYTPLCQRCWIRLVPLPHNRYCLTCTLRMSRFANRRLPRTRWHPAQ